MGWFEDDAFWRELYPYMFPLERFAVADEQVGQLIALSGCTSGAVLDLCCGPGRHSIAFAQRGFSVTGVDRTTFLLDRARERAVDARVSVEWVQEDMRRFLHPSFFDLACSVFTSFGYFEDEADDLLVLRNVHASLKDAGVFVVETLGKERLARSWLDSICTDYPDGATLIQRPKVVGDWCRIRNEWILFRDGQSRTFHFEHSVYSGRELKDRLLSCGFSQVHLFGDLKGSPYGLDAQRLVALARK